MKTSTKLTFYNADTGHTITDFFLGGSYELQAGQSRLTITRDGETYTITEESEQFVAYGTRASDSKRIATILPIYDLDSLKQNLEARCSIVKGEALYNTRLGVPIGLPIQDIKLSVLNTINNTYGVQNCTLVRNYIQNGTYRMDVKVQSDLGTVLISVNS